MVILKNFKKQIVSVIRYRLLIVWIFVWQIPFSYAASDDNQFIAEQKAKEASLIAPYADEISQIAATAQKNAQTPAIQAYIHQLQARHVLLNPASYVSSTSSTGQILIFVSASMPPTSLSQWFDQAQKVHAAIIVRGFIHNSLPDTKSWVKGFMEQHNKKSGIEINPVAFERYGIQQVPAVVVTYKTIQCPLDMSCLTPPFDVVYGNVSLPEALRIIANQGDTANVIAQQALNQMRTASE